MSKSPLSSVFVALSGALALSGCLGSAGDAKSGSTAGFDECPSGLIEDFEDGDAQIVQQEGRAGYWYPEADDDGTTITPDGEFENLTPFPKQLVIPIRDA